MSIVILGLSFHSNAQNDYTKEWSKVDSLEKKGLFNMALTEVGKIFNKATKDKNHNQVIKTVFYELKYNSYLKEDDYVLGLYKLNELIEDAPSPSKELLHSITAEVYWGYYQANSWKFAQRTQVESDYKLEDVRTWDLKRIADKVIYHYKKSLDNAKISQASPIERFNEIILHTTDTKDFRPTLYDFLAHRSIDFFSTNSFNVPGPAETFTINNPDYFSTNTTFLNLNVSSNDKYNTKYYSVLTYKLLTDFHLRHQNQSALLMIEFERLNFVYQNTVLENKDEWFEKALIRMTNVYPKNEHISEVWYKIAEIHNKLGDTYSSKIKNEAHRWEKKKAFEICKKTISAFPNTYGAKQCEALLSKILEKHLSFDSEIATIPQQNSLFKVNYKNTNQVYFKIFKFDNRRFNQLDEEKQYKFLNNTKPVYQKLFSLNDFGDFQTHSKEFLIPGLDIGHYLLVLCSDEVADRTTYLSYQALQVTNLTFQIATHKNIGEVLVTNRKTGAPVKNATVTVTYKNYDYKVRKNKIITLGKYITNEKGLVTFTNHKNDHYNGYYASVEKNDDHFDPNAYFYLNYRDRSLNSPIGKTAIFTDRKLYRPGQTIYFKGISYIHFNNENQLSKNKTSIVKFYDVNHQEIGKVNVKTNEFGSFTGQFIVPYGVLTGNMTISNQTGSTNFRVEEYKRPKFNTEILPLTGEYQLNDSVVVVGVAKAFAGNVIDGATVTYRITRTTRYNNWRWGWWWHPTETEKEIDFGEVTTDEKGEYYIKFKAIPDLTKAPKNLPIFDYKIYVDVTDINGETHSTQTSVSIGYHSLLLSNNIPNELANTSPFTLVVKATNLNNQPITAKGKLEIHQLKTPNKTYRNRLWEAPDVKTYSKEEFEKLFPLDEYENENDYHTWQIEKTVVNLTFDTKTTDSINLKKLNKWSPGMYHYKATTIDKKGIEVIDETYFLVYNIESEKPAINETFKVRSLTSTVQPGEKAKYVLSTAEKDLNVFMTIEHKGDIVKEEWINLSHEQMLIEIPVEEKHRGNFSVCFSSVKNNRPYETNQTVKVPFKNKTLDLVFSTFRNKLLPGQSEEWILTIKNAEGKPEMAELLATLYDASLDELYMPNNFYLNLYKSFNRPFAWSSFYGFGSTIAHNRNYYWMRNDISYPYRHYPAFNNFGYALNYYGNYYNRRSAPSQFYDGDIEMLEDEAVEEPMLETVETTVSGKSIDKKSKAVTGGLKRNEDDKIDNQQTPPAKNNPSLTNIKARSNFNETAFFYPQLVTDKDGNIKIKFTIPESLTKWRFLGLAHTQDLKVGTINEEVVTQKDLMVQPNAPRFLREGDKITIATKIVNLSKKELQGQVLLQLINPFTEKVINSKFNLSDNQQNFEVKPGRSTSVQWTINVPYNLNTVKYKIVAQAGSFSDGEENVLPILSNRMLVTESLPMPIRGKQTKSFKFVKLINQNNHSKTLVNHRYTLEFTSNPAWYAVQAMPYMMEYPYECSEQIFTRYYSNAIAAHIMNSNPKIKQVIEDWGKNSPEAFLSNLQKNQELKELLLEETPWVLNAKSEEETKRNLSILLDMNRMSLELDKALGILIKRQSVNGGWPWFSGMKESRYITQHIITGMGHLDHLGIKDVRENGKVWNMIKKGVQFLDNELIEDLKNIKKRDKDYLKHQHLSYTQIQYMYMRSYFPKIGMNNQTKEALNYFKNQATTYWLKFNIYAEGMIALAAHRFEMNNLANDIVKSLKDRAIYSEEFGMYWKDFHAGYYWYQAPIETQALMIEMFDEVTNDQKSVEELKIWLLKQKQTTHWKTTKQTTEAVYALLLKGTNLLASDDLVQISVGGKPIEYVNQPNNDPYKVNAQAGTGYFKTAWDGEAIKPKMGEVTVTKTNTGVAWGALYWQYFEDLDKITFHETPLKLNKQLFLLKHSNNGETLTEIKEGNQLKVGDKVRVRIELRTDRNLEYVHMKDMRASGFEPINVLSQYKWREGLGYYEATKDASTNFFFDYIPKGTYVFEYDLRVQHQGDFSNGITTIQCMYAPEFTSHSEGIRVKVVE
jgi:uncharacterized protein YfaS (alpha-2-macroglobulin family)